jgi:hypothetical protein
MDRFNLADKLFDGRFQLRTCGRIKLSGTYRFPDTIGIRRFNRGETCQTEHQKNHQKRIDILLHGGTRYVVGA